MFNPWARDFPGLIRKSRKFGFCSHTSSPCEHCVVQRGCSAPRRCTHTNAVKNAMGLVPKA
eukprot:1779531-Alexandrium_andersonii.AAC.1